MYVFTKRTLFLLQVSAGICKGADLCNGHKIEYTTAVAVSYTVILRAASWRVRYGHTEQPRWCRC